MELSSPDNAASTAGLQASSRRRSGRVTKQPEVLSPSKYATAKRSHQAMNGHDEDGASESEDNDDDDEEESADEEELREKRQKPSKPRKAVAAPKKPATKRAKTTIDGPMPVRTTAASRPRKTTTQKTVPIAAAGAQETGGLYGELFGQENVLDEVAADWTKRFGDHQSMALAEIVNLVLRAAGCEIEVDQYDIEDPDNATSKLTDIQDAFQKETQTDYPIISKAKGHSDFKRALVGFFNTLIRTLAATGLMWKEPDLMENVEVWVAALSSGSNRPFRHTATVVSLAMLDGLCSVGKALVDSQAKWRRQAEGEAKKIKVNTVRVKELNASAQQDANNLGIVDDLAKDFFDGIFVHRYRDVDEKIRVESIAHLSHWIMTYPDRFFEGTYMRYLGWLLSDTAKAPRLETVKQLQKIYKDGSKVVGLQAFTERFKSRVVEIATRDAEVEVRAQAVDLLDTLRAAGVLEPHDVDSIGRLIFDAEPKVRKAVVPFFVASVEDSFTDKKDELGGDEAVEEGVPLPWADEDDGDLEKPRLAWLKLKALVELLDSFEPDEAVSEHQLSLGPALTTGTDSHFSIAAKTLYAGMSELSDWQTIAGYLIHDMSVADDASSLEQQFMQQTLLTGTEESILLDLLNVSVAMSVSGLVEEGKADKTKRSKKEQLAFENKQEEAVQALAVLIPKLLNKFGASPQAASAVLRLQRTLRLDVFQELRQDSTTFAALLDDIQKQFMSHKTSDVLTEASNAFMHARQFQGLDEITEAHVQSIWDNLAYALVMHCRGEDLETRGAIDLQTLVLISNTVLRIVSLARKCDCISAFDKSKTYKTVQKSRRKTTSEISATPISLLLALVNRGIPTSTLDAEVETIENELVSNTISALLCYFMWQAHSLRSRTARTTTATDHDEDFTPLAESFTQLHTSLTRIITSHPRSSHSQSQAQPSQKTEPLRIQASSDLLNLHSTFALSADSTTAFAALQSSNLLPQLEESTLKATLHIFTALEREYARLTNKTLESPGEDEDPEEDPESSPEPESDAEGEGEGAADDDGGAGSSRRREKKLKAQLMAEHVLCESTGRLVVAVLTGVVPKALRDGVRERVCRNKSRLGANFAAVVALLLVSPGAAKNRGTRARPSRAKGKGRGATATPQKKARASATAAAKGKGKPVKSKEVVDESEEEEDDEEDEEARLLVGDEEELRRRGLILEEEEVAARDLKERADRRPEASDEEESIMGD